MKKFCVTSLLTFVTLSAAPVTQEAKKSSESASPIHVQAIMQAARTAKNVAVNIQKVDPKNVTVQDFNAVVVPEPGTSLLIGSAMVGLAFLSRRRKRS